VKRLDGLGFIWDVLEQRWEEGFSALMRYEEVKEDCKVPKTFIDNTNFRLGRWVSLQREKSDKLSLDRVKRLDDLGFIWDVFEQQWEAGFSALMRYEEANRDCKVPQRFIDDTNFKLGSWVGSQRRKKDKLSPEKLTRLNDIGFVWKTK
jgi:hypothetical protein